MKKITVLFYILVFILGLTLISYAEQEYSIIGKWKVNTVGYGSSIFEFKPDGSFSVNNQIQDGKYTFFYKYVILTVRYANNYQVFFVHIKKIKNSGKSIEAIAFMVPFNAERRDSSAPQQYKVVIDKIEE